MLFVLCRYFFLLRVISIFVSIFTVIPSPLIVSYFTVSLWIFFFSFVHLLFLFASRFSSRYLSYFHFPLLVIFFCTKKPKVPFLCFASDQHRNPTTLLNAVQTTDPQYRLYNTDFTTLLHITDGEPGIKFHRMWG